MVDSKKLLHGTVVLMIGRVAGYALSFLRNLILARVLAKADYGLAAAFGMAVTLLEVSGSMAFGVQIVQSKQGDTPEFQASAHALQFAGGSCSAVLLACTSMPMARLFGVPHAWWAFALLAIVPLCQGLAHLDISSRQRELDYLPLVTADVVSQFVITAAVWPLVLWLRDYRVIVFLMIGRAVVGSAMTFFLARRPYRWAWERTYIRSMLNFGWPLLLTGLVYFVSLQADQVLVGSVFSLSVLASYALASSLVSIPWFVFSQVGGSLMLPLISRVQDDPERFCRQYRLCVQIAAISGVLCLLPLIVAGDPLIRLLYGAKYQGTGAFVAILGAAWTVRFLRQAPTLAAVAKADTINSLYSNLCRAASFPLALVVVAMRGSPLQIAACAIVGEILAAVASAVRIARRGVPLRESYSASIYLVTLVSVGLGFSLLGGASLNIWSAAWVAVGSFLIALCAAWFMFPEMAHLCLEAFRRKSGASIEPATS